MAIIEPNSSSALYKGLSSYWIKAFKDSAQELYDYDAENKKQYELPSYNPDSNESLLPILNQYGGFGSKTKERISTIDATDWASEKK